MAKTRLFPLIALAVLLMAASSTWLLIEVWLNSRPVDDAEADRLNEQNTLNVQQMQDGLSNRVADSLSSEQQERMQSPLGLAMFRKCVEWTEFNENHPGDVADANEKLACAEFRRYVETGVLPEQE